MKTVKYENNTEEVFANNIINMEDIRIIGFDFESVLFPITNDILKRYYHILQEKLIDNQ